MKSRHLTLIYFALMFLIIIIVVHRWMESYKKHITEKVADHHTVQRVGAWVWQGAKHSCIPFFTGEGKLIYYGYNLIAHTSVFLGPKGTVGHISNGMNCQNCHLDGATVPWGNNFGKVYATYPLFFARSNSVESINDRINDCFERSMNGLALDTNSKEIKAIFAYIKWLGNNVPKGDTLLGTTIIKLPYMNIVADSVKGRKIYANKCSTCHQADGDGKLNTNKTEYIYPPLWGRHSYNDGAGLYQLSKFASFIKNNMPFGTDYRNPKLSDDDAWNIAAFVNSRPRPHRDQTADWKNPEKKPFDFPFGPYNDTFSEAQHKFGPFKPIQDAHKINSNNNKKFACVN